MDELSLSASLAEFLQHPVIEVRVSDSKEVEQLRRQNEDLQRECARCLSLYSDECQINMRYADILREHGLPLK